ncbi:hypothetical protein BD779DRAFT_1679554 [Infundibulicybe gibba]|nr:hypothetical protein BD779DRAFT_1679554 [Infundibulicybe gibba]
MPPKKITSHTAVKTGPTTPKATATASPSKRKAIYISDGSVSEVDTPSPSKKAKFKSTLPAPGGSDFDNLPAFSTVVSQSSGPGICRKLSFGSLPPGTGEDSPNTAHGDRSTGATSSTRPVRTKIPTEKAIFNNALRSTPKTKKATAPIGDDFSDPSDTDLPAPPRLVLPSPGKTRAVWSRAPIPTTPPPPEAAPPSPEIPGSPATTMAITPPLIIAPPLAVTPPLTAMPPPLAVTPSPLPNARRSIRAGKQRAPTPFTPPPVPTMPFTTPRARSARSHKQRLITPDSPSSPATATNFKIPKLAIVPDHEAVESGNEGALSGEEAREEAVSSGEEGSAVEDKESQDAGENSGTDDGSSPQAIPAAATQETVMCDSLQDPQLRPYYVGLPFLDQVCDVQSYGSGDSQPGSARAEFSALVSVISQSSIKSLKKGLLFERSGFFVNTARIHPNRLTTEGGRLKIAVGDRPVNAVGIMLGVTTECLLAETGTYGSVNAYNVHRITIAPFKQEWRRDVAVWGNLLGFTLITGSHSHLGMSFTTRKESGTSSAVQQMTGTIRTPGTSVLTTGFHEQIPIYDSRARSGHHFMFSDENFQSLTQMPLYRGGGVDLPFQSLVAVGYTLGCYAGTNGPILSSNIQFVVLLGVPTS